MERIFINLFVLSILLALLALAESAMENSYGPYNQQASYVPDTSSTPPPPPPHPNPTCRKQNQLCGGYGDYACCEGLYCLGWTPEHPGGLGLCTPLDNQQPPSKDNCRHHLQECQLYGPYVCCQGLNCVHPRNLPTEPVIKTRKKKLPPGTGVCAYPKL
ncbi:uncharacterized protein LOC110720765 [Chenopodium quinoa]|uniref:uncharacterized protein LOC110720765 n=1 Tax=Chenopodium quinoa TaxID=63459 RepID=UPI000B782356|nr:uncharacterized protein LOC110720765 [Chenopodium quinoa]